MMQLRIVPCDMPTSLVDCPPGLFLFGFEKGDAFVGFKSEYGAHNPHDMEVYCADSGELFWGGTNSKSVRGDLRVMPAKLEWVEA